MKYLLYTLIIISSFACSNGKKYERYSKFTEEKTLISEVIGLDTISLRYPFRIMVKDSVVVILDMHNTDHFLHAFTYPEWKHIVSFGKRGEKPEEMSSAETLRFVSVDSIWVLDPNKSQIIRWSVSSTDKSANLEDIVTLDKRLIRTLDFHPYKSGFIVPDYTGEYRYCILSDRGKYLKSGGAIHTEKRYKKTVELILAQGWRSFIDYHPATGTLVTATQLGEVLDIYNLKDSTKSILYGPHGEPDFQIEQTEMIPTGIMGFSDVKITDKYIYTVFHGQKFEDIIKCYQKGIKPELGGKNIYVFDLKGKPLKKYYLDRAVYGIYVDEKNNTILATDVNGNEPIVKFSLI